MFEKFLLRWAGPKTKFTSENIMDHLSVSKGELRRRRKNLKAAEKKEERKKLKAEAKEEKEKALIAAGKKIPWLQPTKLLPPGIKTRQQLEREEIMAKISVHGFHIVLDMSFFGLMKPKECVSLRQQVAYCYSANRKASIPAKTFLTSTSPEALEVLNVMMGFSNWPSFSVHSECYMDLFPKESLVYLTADSQNELEKIDFSKIYIIGAFVDKNRHKGITMLKAKDQGISTAYLPLNKYLDMKGTKVLTVNHVFDILLKIAAGSGNMKKAVEEGVPGRKHSDLKRDMTESFISSKRLCLEECNASNNTEDNATVHVDLDNSEPISNEVFDV